MEYRKREEKKHGLKSVVFYFVGQQNREVEELAGELAEEGISCEWYLPEKQRAESLQKPIELRWKAGEDGESEQKKETWYKKETWCKNSRLKYYQEHGLIVTDSRDLARRASLAGLVCVGYDKMDAMPGTFFFDGAVLVTDSLTELDAQLLEETFLRAKGLPVIIARTQRLVIREMIPDDFAALRAISLQPGMEYLMMNGQCAREFFSDENLSGYIASVYRFYGYGLWSVLLHDGTLIGCCGLQDIQITEKEAGGLQRNVSERVFGGSEKNMPESAYGEAERNLPERWFGEADPAAGKPAFENQGESVESVTRCLDLQYMLDPKFHRQGLGTEMCRAALCYAFARTDAETVRILCHRDNIGSRSLARKLGFGQKEAGEIVCCYLKLSSLSMDGKCSASEVTALPL